MDTAIVLIVIAVVILAAGAAAYLYQKRRSDQLQERFGPEYERTLEESGDDRRAAERELAARQKRVAKLDIHPITGSDAEQYRGRWNALQGRFVDEPSGAVDEADALVVQMMREAGYPIDDFDQRVGDISVDHPDVAQHYRSAHDIAIANTAGTADTEQLRQAVTAYRRLVDVLLDDDEARTRRNANDSTVSGTGTDSDRDNSDGHLDADRGGLHATDDADDADGSYDPDRTDGDPRFAVGGDQLGTDGDPRFAANRTDGDLGSDADPRLDANRTDGDLDSDTDPRLDADHGDLGDDADRRDGDRANLRSVEDTGGHDDHTGHDLRTAADRSDFEPDQRTDDLADRRRSAANTDRTDQS